MIAYLKGNIIVADFDRVIIAVGGIGYGVCVPVSTSAQLVVGSEAEILISEVVREQSFDLYGFINSEEQKLFEILIKVSGVGPRLAMAILGLGSSSEMASAVTNEDDRYFSRAPGVGKKLAERLLIELRDKVIGSFYGVSNQTTASGNPDALSALVALGFSSEDARSMLVGVDETLKVEQQITAALKNR